MTQAVASTQIRLRDYQHSAIQETFRSWHCGDRRALLQLPTGGGKTVIFAEITRQFVVKGSRVLVLVHREELLRQSIAKLQQVCQGEVGAIKAGYPETPLAPIQVASVQTLVKRPIDLEQFDLVIVDEAHHAAAGTYQAILEACPNAYHLGVTATPKRLDGKGLSDLFDCLIPGPSVRELIEQGHLSQYRMFAPAAAIETKGVRSLGGDFNVGQLRQAALADGVMGAIVPSWLELAQGKQTVVFCVDIEHSQSVCEAFLEQGIVAAHLDGTIPTDERRNVLGAFRDRKITVLTNCGIISEGLDIPGIEAVQILRPTQSVSLYLQQIGRALRPVEGKEYAIVVDHTTNWVEHGLPDDEREWSLDGTEKRQRQHLERSQNGEVREIEQCEISHDTSIRLAEVSGSADPELIAKLDALIKQQQRFGYKPGWVAYRFLELKPSVVELRICAGRLGYKTGWVRFALQQLQEEGAA